MSFRLCVAAFLPLLLAASSDRRELDAVVARARADGAPYVVAILVEGREGAESWARELRESPGWRDSLPPDLPSVVVRVDRSPSVAARFGGTRFPMCLLLDSEGREVGRLQGQGDAGAVAESLGDLLETARGQASRLRVLEGNPEDVEALFGVGLYRWNRGERRLAAGYFRKILEIVGRAPPDGSEAEPQGPRRGLLASTHCYVAEEEIEAGSAESAEGHFRKALELAPEPVTRHRALLGLALCLRSLDRTDDAIGVLEEYVSSERGTDLDRALFSLGYLRLEAGDFDSARRHFRACAALFGDTRYGSRARRYLERLGGPEGDAEEAFRPPTAPSALRAGTSPTPRVPSD